MSLFTKLFGRKPNNADTQETSEKINVQTIEEFQQLNPQAKMSIIITFGESGKMEYFPFLKHAVLIETDPNVKFAALKRIHHFKNHPDTVAILTELKNNGKGEKLEPYFSMALSRLGIISIEDFEKKING